jgi:tetratricopeptide (TPR) repeat protein
VEPAPYEEPFMFEPAPEPGVPDEYFLGKGYLGAFPDSWKTDILADPVNAKVFLALQDGARREALSGLDVSDLDLALGDLISARMVRESGGVYRPAFPIVREEARKKFDEAVKGAADRAYARLRPALPKIRQAAEGEKVLPWLYTLLWAEVLESRDSERTFARSGGLVAQRLRDEGYFWILIPGDPYTTGVDRYNSGRETLHYLWTPVSLPNPAVQDFITRRLILEDAVGRKPWEDEGSREIVAGFGILDAEKQVRVPVLRKDSRLLKSLRKASRGYAKDLLRTLPADLSGQSLGASRDEAFAAAFACAGYRVMEKAVTDGFLARPDYLSQSDSPVTGLVESLVITENETADPLERAYYLYDREDFTGAIAQADAFLKDHPGDSEALFRKGMSLMKMRKYPEALQVFAQAASRPVRKEDVWRGWLLVRMGNVLDMMERREDALKRYAEALQYADVAGSHDTARGWMESVYRD